MPGRGLNIWAPHTHTFPRHFAWREDVDLSGDRDWGRQERKILFCCFGLYTAYAVGSLFLRHAVGMGRFLYSGSWQGTGGGRRTTT